LFGFVFKGHNMII